MDLALRSVQAHFARMYGPRNSLVNGPFHERASHMTRRIGRLVDAERKNQPMEGKLARAVSYFMSVINYFNGAVDLARGMANKFPSYGCAYCGHMPCDCHTGHRLDHRQSETDPLQFGWTIQQWQDHLCRVYGPKNKERVSWEVIGRLVSEFSELSILNVHGPNTPLKPSQVLDECEKEAADVFSWILAVGYVKEISVQEAVLARYEVCPGCKFAVCDCPLVFLSDDGTHFSTVGTQRDTCT
jgi:hypothetical protein